MRPDRPCHSRRLPGCWSRMDPLPGGGPRAAAHMGGDGGEISLGRWSRGRDQVVDGVAEVGIIESVVA